MQSADSSVMTTISSIERMMLLHSGIMQQRQMFSTSALARIRESLSRRSQRVEEAVQQRNEMLEYIREIASLNGTLILILKLIIRL